MLTTGEGELLPLHIACLEGRLHQIRQEWSQLGQWVHADQQLLAGVQAQTEQVQALLEDPGFHDQQVRNALRELLVIGHVQQFLLERLIHGAEDERIRLQEESDQAHQAMTLLRRDADHSTLGVT